jgi:hypothetical protein
MFGKRQMLAHAAAMLVPKLDTDGFSFEGIASIVPHGKNKSDLQADS